jgi:uncharacterized protein (TIGR03435 family)
VVDPRRRDHAGIPPAGPMSPPSTCGKRRYNPREGVTLNRISMVLVALVCAPIVAAQQPLPAFEVASVKPNTTDAEPSMIVPPGGLVSILNVPLENLIVNAYGIPAFRVLDAPAWATRERFDISAKIPDDATPGQARAMLQSLLEGRFRLRVHRETREQSIYAVVVARADGRLGPRLKQSTADCAAAAKPASPLTLSPDGQCAAFFGVGPAGGRIVSRGQPLARVISALSMAVSRGVVDRTGLQGPFDVELEWSADAGAAATASNTPSVFTALQEQLGLRLEPSRGPVEVLVIDSVERPTPD